MRKRDCKYPTWMLWNKRKKKLFLLLFIFVSLLWWVFNFDWWCFHRIPKSRHKTMWMCWGTLSENKIKKKTCFLQAEEPSVNTGKGWICVFNAATMLLYSGRLLWILWFSGKQQPQLGWDAPAGWLWVVSVCVCVGAVVKACILCVWDG